MRLRLPQTRAGRSVAAAAAVVVVLALVGSVMAFEPVTRTYVAQDAVCTYCHMPWEFAPDVRLSATRPHDATPQGGQATCAACHLPEGLINAANVYLHIAQFTDLFGHVRAIDEERGGTWTAYRAKTAHRVRDRLAEHDSSTCRSCHIESEIKPKRERGVNAHKLALDEKKTCIACHYNLVHRSVDLRQAGSTAEAQGTSK